MHLSLGWGLIVGLVSKDVNKESGRCFSFLFWTQTNVGWSNHRSSPLRKTEGCKAWVLTHTHTHTHTQNHLSGLAWFTSQTSMKLGFVFFLNLHQRICLLIWEREREIEREKHQMVASHMHPDWGSNPQPRYVPWPGMKPASCWCMGWCSNQLSHPASTRLVSFCPRRGSVADSGREKS